MTDRIGLGIDPITNDLFLRPDGQLAVVRDAEAIGQHVRQRLKFFEGEWFLDTTAGVPWLDEILGKAYDPALAEAVTKKEILDTDGVVEITAFSVRYNRVNRGMDIHSVELLTDYDSEVQI